MLRQSKEFTQILNSSVELELALTTDSTWLQAYDENQNTLLHHVIIRSSKIDSSCLVDIREVLRRAPNLNLHAQDKNMNTPLHVAAWNSGVDNVSSLLLPFFIEKAVEQHFHFSTRGELGLTVLQIAAKVRDSLATCEDNNVKTILDKVKKFDIDELSEEGATAFYYAVASANFIQAKTLLDHRANPFHFGNSRYDAIALIKHNIDFLADDIDVITKRDLSTEVMNKDLKSKKMLLNSYQALLRYIHDCPHVRQYAEIRKNARVLYQAQQQAGLMFSLPDDLLIKIAAHTAHSEVYTEQAATTVSQSHFKRPLT